MTTAQLFFRHCRPPVKPGDVRVTQFLLGKKLGRPHEAGMTEENALQRAMSDSQDRNPTRVSGLPESDVPESEVLESEVLESGMLESDVLGSDVPYVVVSSALVPPFVMVTCVPMSVSRNSTAANASGNRMQPCDAG